MVLRQLNATHAVRLLDVDHLTGDEAIAHEAAHPIADLYLLKSHTPQALSVAHHLEQRGAVVINSWASALACQDRVRMVQLPGTKLKLKVDQYTEALTIQSDLAPSPGSGPGVNLVFSSAMMKQKVPVTVFLVNGVKLQGIITWFDNFCVLLRRDGLSQLVYKHAISTIMPGGPVQLYEIDKAADEADGREAE